MIRNDMVDTSKIKLYNHYLTACNLFKQQDSKVKP